MNLKSKIDYSISLIQRSAEMALKMHPDGFNLAFSGGKDSIVLYRLAQMAGVKFTAHMQITTLDPPELMKFVRSQYPEVKYHLPEINFFELIKKKKSLPLRQFRYCCHYLKERNGDGKCVLLGIRKAESVMRAKRNEVGVSKNKYCNTLDQFNIDNEAGHICMKGKDKLFLSPIFHWADRDIWQFIRENDMPYCNLYDNGYKRIGCMFCPMANIKTKILDRKNYPGVEKAIKKSIQYLIDTVEYGNRYNATADEIFDWWISNKSLNDYFLNLRKQLKIDFT